MSNPFLSQIFCSVFRFNLLIFDGPGQGTDGACKGTKLRHDWEVVMSSVIDHAERKLGFDLSNGIASYGISLGGYLCLRASLHEPRLHATVLDPINPSNRLAMFSKLPASFVHDMLSETPGTGLYNKFLWSVIQKKGYQALASRAQVHGIDVTQKSTFFEQNVSS